MKKFLKIIIFVVILIGFVKPNLILAVPSYPIDDAIIDGVFTSPTEFSGSHVELVPGLATLYFGHHAESDGTGLLYFHNDFWYDTIADDEDYNYFLDTFPNGTTTEVWAFAFDDTADDSTWIGDSGLGYASVDDRGFIVRANGDPLTDVHWLPGDAKPDDPGFSWDTYYGIFAAADYGPSRTISGDVVHYEYAIKGGMYQINPPFERYWWECNTLYREVKDLPNIADGVYIIYEGPLHPVPEPTTMILLGSGLIGLAGFSRKKFKK